MSDKVIEHGAPDSQKPVESRLDLAKIKETTMRNNVLVDGLKIVGEVVITPGISLLLDGKLKSGIAHVGVGFIARRLFGLPGVLLVGADSYSQSVTGKSLLEHVQATFGGVKEETLGQRVTKAMNANKPLHEILATVAEDVEDKYHSLTHKT